MFFFLFGMGVGAALAYMLSTKQWDRWPEVLLGALLTFTVGLLGLLGAFAHTFRATETARMIGFPPGNPFQHEVAMANLAVGIVALLCYWIRGTYWIAATLVFAIYFLGCFVFHLIEYYFASNDAPYNIGAYIWYVDFFLPLFMLALLYINYRKKSPYQWGTEG